MALSGRDTILDRASCSSSVLDAEDEATREFPPTPVDTYMFGNSAGVTLCSFFAGQGIPETSSMEEFVGGVPVRCLLTHLSRAILIGHLIMVLIQFWRLGRIWIQFWHHSAADLVVCAFQLGVYFLLPVVTPLAALKITCTETYAKVLKQVTENQNLDEDEPTRFEPYLDDHWISLEGGPHEAERLRSTRAIEDNRLKTDDNSLKWRIQWSPTRTFCWCLLGAFLSVVLPVLQDWHDVRIMREGKSFFTPIVVACSCVVFGCSTVPLAATMHFAELRIIAYRRYVASILGPNEQAIDASEHWAKCADKYLRLSTGLADQATWTRWLFISVHGSFATFLTFIGLLIWSKGTGQHVLDALVLTSIMAAVWFGYLWAGSRVTTSATDGVMTVVLSYVGSIGDDSPKASTTGVNTFRMLVDKRPTGCYLFPFFGIEQVLSKGFITKILALPIANMLIYGIRRLSASIEPAE